MSRWHVAREQWVAFVEAGPLPPARRSLDALDALDAELCARLARIPFPSGDEATQSRPAPAQGVDAFDSMTTMVRSAIDDDEDDRTRVRGRSPELDVALRAPESTLEVALEPSSHAEDADDADEPELLSVVGETVVMEAPLPRVPPQPPPADDEGGWRRVEPPSPAAATDDDLFIPALTRPTPVPGTLVADLEPPPVDRTVVAPAPVDPVPPPPTVDRTVVAPPPVRPPEPSSASTSTTSGIITTGPDEPEAAKTLIRGELPGNDDVPDTVVPPKSKVVVDPSASGVFRAVYDEEETEVPDDAVEAVEEAADELDADELDADDLVEEEAPDPEPLPPPAPSRPPPARDPDAPLARTPRPPLDVGPPPPPVSHASLEAALSVLPAAPPLDEGWQVDAFGEHHGALVSPLRAAAAAAEVDFIVHCAGLHPGAAVLDVGCGDGAHVVGLAARGLHVTGLDASPVQLARASQAAQQSGANVRLVAGDMRKPNVDGPFDAIVCIGSTLGMYTDEDDRTALQHMRDRLVPGGRVILQVLNRDYLVARLPARSWWQGQGCLVLDEAQMFAPTSRVHVHRTVVFETGTQFEHNIGLRLYGLTELVQMCAQVGLRVLEYSGSRHTRGRFYGGTSSEIWLLAQRAD